LFDLIDRAIKGAVSGVDARLQEGGAFLLLFGKSGGELVELGKVQIDDGEGSGTVLVLSPWR
jgi:hypothetical protein